MARLKDIIVAQVSSSSQRHQQCITPGPDLPWEHIGSGPERLLEEVEKLYWHGVQGEVKNIIETLRTWQEYSSKDVDDPIPSQLDGYDTFITNITQWPRKAAEIYSR